MNVDNNFQTPMFIGEYMVQMLPSDISKILEPTPGSGNLIKAIQNRFNDIEITSPDDFFLMNTAVRFDAIIMNPPFSSKSANTINAPSDANINGMAVGYYILNRCMDMSDNIIALMPWFTISDSDVRLRALKNFGLRSVTPLPRKTFQYARIQTVVLQLIKGYSDKTIFNTFFH